MRPIDADALREIVENELRNNPHKDGPSRVFHRSEYTHFLDVIQRMPTIAPPPNDPLTLEELREMDGEPVWIKVNSGGRYAVVRYVGRYFVEFTDAAQPSIKDYGKNWRAYRRKPEEASISFDEGPKPQRDNEPWKDFLSHRFERKE